LFIERARARAVDFEPTNEERSAIDDICARVDWTPLAIELAAARVGSLGAITLARRMEHPLAVLTRGDRDLPERQRSLRAAIDWTYSLLADAPRSLFERLGVCSGPVPLTTIEAIADPGQDETPVDLLEMLVECSLVRQHRDSRLGIRFSTPQVLRDYALERLAGSGLEYSVRRQYAEHVAGVAHAARLWKWGATTEQQTDLLALSEEVRPTVGWARENDRELHVRLCAALAPYWVYRGIVPEVSEELSYALDSGLGSVAERAWISTFLAKCLQLEGNHDAARGLADQALANWRMLGDEREYAFGTGDLTWVYRWASCLDQALILTEQGLEILRRTHDRRLILRALVFLAHVLIDLKDLRRARTVLEEADQLALSDPSVELDTIHGDYALLSGDYPQAIEYYVKSLAWTDQSGESHQVVIDTLALATALARAGHGPAALEVRELAQLQQQRTGRVDVEPDRIEQLEQALSETREQLGPNAAATATAKARRVPPNLRIARALRLGQQPLSLASPNQETATPRST
jgi:tetratricopeptide (TPR) repeat protein